MKFCPFCGEDQNRCAQMTWIIWAIGLTSSSCRTTGIHSNFHHFEEKRLHAWTDRAVGWGPCCMHCCFVAKNLRKNNVVHAWKVAGIWCVWVHWFEIVYRWPFWQKWAQTDQAPSLKSCVSLGLPPYAFSFFLAESLHPLLSWHVYGILERMKFCPFCGEDQNRCAQMTAIGLTSSSCRTTGIHSNFHHFEEKRLHAWTDRAVGWGACCMHCCFHRKICFDLKP